MKLQSAIGVLAGNLHLPHRNRRSGLGDFENGSVGCRRWSGCTFVKFDVAVFRLAERATKKRKQRSELIHPGDVGSFCGFVKMENRNTAFAGSGGGPAERANGIQYALVSVVKKQDVDRSRGGGADDIGVVLGVEPAYGGNGIAGSGL